MQHWLDARPDAPPAGPKEFACSQMAGWYAEFGSENFYEKLWCDERVAAALQPRLTACRAWQVAQTLAE